MTREAMAMAAMVIIAGLASSIPAHGEVFSTFLGGTGWDSCVALGLTPAGSIIAAGETYSSDFPVTGGCYDSGSNGSRDFFVAILSPDLGTLIAGTFVGGAEYDVLYSMAVAQDGTIALTGTSESADFPTTPGAYDRTFNSTPGAGRDAVVFELSADLTELLCSTFLGGQDNEEAHAIALSENGRLAVTGSTFSEDFPVTPGAFDNSFRPPSNIFLSAFSPDLGSLEASTFIGGRGGNQATAVLFLSGGDLLLAGEARSEEFPVTTGAYDTTWDGLEGFLLRIESDLQALVASTFIGGSEDDYAAYLALDGQEAVLIAGVTGSSDFPVTPWAFDTSFSGEYLQTTDAFIVRMSLAADQLLAGTYLGGRKDEYLEYQGCGLAVDLQGNVLVVGMTRSGNFPITPDAMDSTLNGTRDAFAAQLSSNLGSLLYGTYLGGSVYDYGYAAACDAEGSILAGGYTESADFPTTAGAFDRAFAGTGEAFLFRGQPAPIPIDLITGPGPGQDNPTLVRLFSAEYPGVVRGQWTAYGVPRFGVNVSGARLRGSEAREVVTGPGPGAVFGPHVRAFDLEGDPLPGVSFLAYGTHRFGVNVACGDLDGDGFDEIVTGAGPGQVFGPHVRGWNWDGTGAPAAIGGISFLAYGTHQWGVNVACGDIDGDGLDEIITGAGPGAVFGPHVRGWNWDGSGSASPLPGVSFLAYGTPQWGVEVACGDIDGDGIDELVTGPGPGPAFAPHVRGWNWDGAGQAQPIPGVSFFAYPVAQWGAGVACGDLDADDIDEILTGRGPGPPLDTRVRGWNCDGGPATLIAEIDFEAYPDPPLGHGAKVAAWPSP